MAARKKSYILTATAENDFRQAKRWSLSRWGQEQTKKYFSDLHDGAEYIARNQPSQTEKRELVGDTGLGIYSVREHYIIYEPVDEHSIIIVSLIRQSRDVPAILRANHYMFRRELKEIRQMITQGRLPHLFS